MEEIKTTQTPVLMSKDIRELLSFCYEKFEAGAVDKKFVIKTMKDLAKLNSDDRIAKGLAQLGIDSFSDGEIICTMMLIDDIVYDGVIPFQFSRFSRNKAYSDIKQGIEGLLQRGILIYESYAADNPEKASERKERYYPSPRFISLLFKGEQKLLKYCAVSRMTEIIPYSTIEEKKLFYNRTNKEDIDRLYTILLKDNYDRIMNRLQKHSHKASATILLYGEPGTGKTELVYQLARRTGRDVLVADVSKLLSSFHGDSEKNFNELFRSYRYLNSVSPLSPILLFNEADAFMSKRGDVIRQSVDKIENRILNLILQYMENFEGILIATTNLAENIDSAFERRFLFKINIQQPDEDTRRKIWQNKLPELHSMAIEILASQYSFSGGQIDNIAKKIEIDSAIYNVEPTLDKVSAYCDRETLVKKKDDFFL